MKKHLVIVLALFVGMCLLQPAQAEQIQATAQKDGKEPAQATQNNAQVKCKVVFHLDLDLEERLAIALENTKNLFKEIPPEACQVSMVANGKAVKLFHKDKIGAHASEIEQLHRLGVRFKACKNAMAKHQIQKDDLFHLFEVVPAGILELINLQAQGSAYIKP